MGDRSSGITFAGGARVRSIWSRAERKMARLHRCRREDDERGNHVRGRLCSKDRPIYIVTEYMRHGSLLNYLRRHETSLGANVGLLLDMCIQVKCKFHSTNDITCGYQQNSKITRLRFSESSMILVTSLYRFAKEWHI